MTMAQATTLPLIADRTGRDEVGGRQRGDTPVGDIEKDFSHLANTLRARRLVLGLSRKKLADRVGRSDEDIENIESGQLKYEMGTVFLLCDELGLVFKDLFRKRDQKDRKVVPFPEVNSRK